ncbi:leishmanolysin-related zinc metalloendopeptidase [Mariniflexile aquimaris]|uniref:Leishmanolysin-related zinc metalloendopeptidase n=1 Tax=Mariniflexile aquimaris TaxID=881009 RepID=A0ABW3BST4_9FLAO
MPTEEDNIVTQSQEQQFTLVQQLSEFNQIKGDFGKLEIGDLNNETLKSAKASGDDTGRFNITLKYLIPPTLRQSEIFDAAVARWERIIIKDVPSFTGTLPSAFGSSFNITGTVDDIIIEVLLTEIDGPLGILGQAGPRYVRSDDFLTLSGVMIFDTADLGLLDELDLFEDVIVHEMGHVLGIGTLWNVEPFFPRTLREGPDSNPYFSGKKANVFWNAEGGTFELPIENMGGTGTALGHWRESTLNNELMTGFLNLGKNPLSRITAGSMRDLGYGSATIGESYDLPRGTPGVNISELGDYGTEINPGLNIAKMEVLLQPIGFVTAK